MNRKLRNKNTIHNLTKSLKLVTGLMLITAHISWGQEVNFDFLDTTLSFEERVEILVGQMGTEEKIGQMLFNAPAIPRLKVPEYGWWNEALHGVAFSGRATVFPEPIGLAASWNKALVKEVANAISDEARAKHHEFVRQGKRNNFQGLTYWAPNINIYRDPRWGRGIETFGEDPYLTGRLGVSFIKGLQGDNPKYLKLVATPKHYAVHSGPEPDRHRFNAVVNNKDLYETYLPHFKEAVQEGGAYSIMSAYNRVNGLSASGHPRLLTNILREEWGFEGYVVSDCGAIRDIYEYHKIVNSKAQAAADGLNSGCDLNCGDYYWNLIDAIEQGLVSDSIIDVSLKRLFLARFKLGMFDPQESVPYASIGIDAVNSIENQVIALKSAQESIVLLKNENNILPLNPIDIETIAVIGPNANDVDVLLGNYNGRPFKATSPLQGIRDRLPNECEVLYAPGADLADGVYIIEDFPGGILFTEKDGADVEGLKGEYFAENGFTYNNDTNVFVAQPFDVRVDKNIKFDWKDGAPIPGMPVDEFSVRWTGRIIVEKTQDYILGAEGHHGYRFYINDSLFLKEDEFYHTNIKRVKNIQLKSGEEYDIRIEFYAKSGDANFRLIWVPNNRELVKDAIAVANKADVVVMCMGLSPRLEGEELGIYLDGFAGGDRTKLHLPLNQVNLIKEIAKTGKPIILVLLNGSALALNWEKENVPAIVEAWYPGQAAGEAIASVLFGDYNPSGRLPVTFYKSVNDLPDFEDYSMKNRTYRYFKGKPLYPFGYGLSYTTFRYSNYKLPEKAKVGEEVVMSVEVTNTGTIAGSEVVQVYVSNKTKIKNLELPNIALKGFEKVYLKPNESKTVEIVLTPDHFSYVDNDGKTQVKPGKFEVSVGGILPGYKCGSTMTLIKKIKIE